MPSRSPPLRSRSERGRCRGTRRRRRACRCRRTRRRPPLPNSHAHGPPAGCGMPLSASIGCSGQMPVSITPMMTPWPALSRPPSDGHTLSAPMKVLASLSRVAARGRGSATGALAAAEPASDAAPDSDAGTCCSEFSCTAATPGTESTAFASTAPDRHREAAVGDRIRVQQGGGRHRGLDVGHGRGERVLHVPQVGGDGGIGERQLLARDLGARGRQSLDVARVRGDRVDVDLHHDRDDRPVGAREQRRIALGELTGLRPGPSSGGPAGVTGVAVKSGGSAANAGDAIAPEISTDAARTDTKRDRRARIGMPSKEMDQGAGRPSFAGRPTGP